jgi:anti-sigma B factor antagonist
MRESHRLHEAQIDGAHMEPVGAFAVERSDAADGVAVIELSGELDMAATSEVRAFVDAAAGDRGLILDLSGATFVDSSMLKELLRAGAELARYETRLVLAGSTPAVLRLLELTRTTALFTLTSDRATALELLRR